MKIKLSDYIFEFLAQNGVKDIFLLPGGGCMHLLDSIGKRLDINHVCCLHEQAAVIAAEAYGQYTNHLGVALVTTGPGGTNAITGVAGAWIDSTPLLILSGQVKRQDMLHRVGVRQMGIQEVDIVSLVRPITKYAVTVMEPESIRFHLQKALALATSGRKGPVWLDIPLDVQGSMVEEASLQSYCPTVEAGDRQKIKKAAQKALTLLAQSKRPVILAGHGIRAAGAWDLFNSVIERLNIPVLLTWRASGLMAENHRLYRGKPGAIGQRGANFTQQNADWIMTLGARLDLCQVGHNYPNFARQARKIVVDIDASEIGKLETLGMPVDVKVHTDVAAFLRVLLDAADEYDVDDFSAWLAQSRQWGRRYPVVLPEYLASHGRVNLYHLVNQFSDVLQPGDLIVPGSSGACAEVVQQAFALKQGQRLLNTPGLGSMGFGLPAAMGACLASGKQRTISIIGDGGLQHNIQELETLARLQLPIKYFILNNGGYGSIKAMQEGHFKARYVCCNAQSGLTLPDICRVGAAYGLKTTRIENQSGLKEKILEVLQTEGTVICDVMIDPNVATSPRLSSQVLPDGSIVSKPLEDLWPFLDRAEFASNMLIETPKED